MQSQLVELSSRLEELTAYGEESLWKKGVRDAIGTIHRRIESLADFACVQYCLPLESLNECDAVYFYQAIDGSKYYLHSLNSRSLMVEFGDYKHFPRILRGKIAEVEEVTIDDDYRRRNSHLRHLSVQTNVTLVELELPFLSTFTLNSPLTVHVSCASTILDEIKRRSKARKAKLLKEKRESEMDVRREKERMEALHAPRPIVVPSNEEVVQNMQAAMNWPSIVRDADSSSSKDGDAHGETMPSFMNVVKKINTPLFDEVFPELSTVSPTLAASTHPTRPMTVLSLASVTSKSKQAALSPPLLPVPSPAPPPLEKGGKGKKQSKGVSLFSTGGSRGSY
jgi:hypothetical protein